MSECHCDKSDHDRRMGMPCKCCVGCCDEECECDCHFLDTNLSTGEDDEP